MPKFVIAAFAIAAALFVTNPSTAKAGTDVEVFLGFGGPHGGVHGIHYRDYRHGHKRYRHRDYYYGDRYYKPRRHYRKRHYRKRHHAIPRWRMVRKMHRRGYYDCHKVRRRGNNYKMRCFRNDRLFKIKANAWSGHIVKRRRLY